MKNGSTLFLKTIIVLIGIGVFTLCVFLIRALFNEDLGVYKLIIVVMLTAAIPFFIGIMEVFKILNCIDQKKAFSKLSVKALNTIKYCGIVISVLYAFSLPIIFAAANKDDAPGVGLLGLIFTFAPMAIAVFAALFQKLLHNAIDLKSENDLTI